MRPVNNSGDGVDTQALGCLRFWLPRGTAPDLSHHGFLLDSDSPRAAYAGTSAAPLGSLFDFPVLGLLGEPGIGKSTAIKQETQRLKAAAQNCDHVLRVDLAACGSDVLVCQKIFGS